MMAMAVSAHPQRFALGVRLHEQGRYQRAARIFASLRTPEADYRHALSLHELGATEQAVELLQQTVLQRPTDADVLWHTALLLDRLGRKAEAELEYRKLLVLTPQQPSAWLNLGNLLNARGAFAEAIDCYERAHHLAPGAVRPLLNLAHTTLLLGDYHRGWRLYHERWSLPDFRSRNGLTAPNAGQAWVGQPISGKRLVVFREQGTGDVIQMLRYDSLLRAMGAEITWRVPAHLFRLARAAVTSDVVTDTERLPAHDYIVPVMSLPFFCGTDEVNKIPAADGYLGLSIPTLPHTGFRVGVAWAGSPHHKRDGERSIPVETFAPLFSVADVRFVNLQFGEREQEGDQYGLERVDVSDYYDTAEVLRSLDLVVACDTSIVHLAGAMGVPCWVMVTHPPDFRWLLDRSDSPWYRSVVIYRQATAGDWASVVGEVREHLTALVESGGGVA